jgi:hypothetical protein
MIEIQPDRQSWNQEYYREVMGCFVNAGYRSATFSEYFDMPKEERHKILLHRIDVDKRFDRIPVLLEVQKELGIKATYFLQMHSDFNIFFYDSYALIRDMIASGMEIGVHSNFVEFAKYFDENPLSVVAREKKVLEAVCGRAVQGHACHRDLNYIYNSLPFVQEVGAQTMGFRWEAYDKIFTSENIEYVNEGFAPRHLGWGHLSPEDAIRTGKNICFLIHPHWWHRTFHDGA